MKIHLLVDSYLDAVLTTVVAELGREHDVAVFDSAGSRRATAGARSARAAGARPAGVRSEEAGRVALTAELAGSLVVNSPAATTAALDRATVAEALEWAGVPTPRSWSVSAMRHLAYGRAPALAAGRQGPAALSPPLRPAWWAAGELVGMCPEWGDEPIVAQQFAVQTASPSGCG